VTIKENSQTFKLPVNYHLIHLWSQVNRQLPFKQQSNM